MTGVRMELTGKEAALAELGALLDRVRNPRGLYDNIGLSLVTSTQARFERGQAPDGSAWPPSLRALAEGGKTLIKSARLMQSITFRAWESGVEIGTNVLYAAIHQFGGAIRQAARTATVRFARSKRTGKLLPGFRKGKNATEQRTATIGARVIMMPARPFIGLDDDDDREVIRLAEDWLAGEGAARP